MASKQSLPTVTERRIGALPGSAGALWITDLARSRPGPLLIIAADARAAERLEAELAFYAGPDGAAVLHFPDWETLPYDVFSPHQDILSRRIETLYRLPDLKAGLVVVPANTLLQRLPPPAFVTGHSLILRAGERLDPHALRARLEAAGYRAVAQVMEHGEFALRGSLMDLFPMGSTVPYRIDLLDDEVDTIRPFDPQTQRSQDVIEEVRSLPAREFPLDEEAIRQFRQRYRVRFEGNPQKSLIYREVSEGNTPGGIEYYLPLFFDQTATLFDYLPAGSTVVLDAGAEAALQGAWEQIQTRHEQRRHDIERPLLSPEAMFVSLAELAAGWQGFARIHLAEDAADDSAAERPLHALPPPALHLNPHAQRPLEGLVRFIQDFDGRVLLAAESPGQREALLDQLRPLGLKPEPCADWSAFRAGTMNLAITVAPLERGLLLPDLAVISESQLSGERPRQRSRKRVSRDPATIIRDLADLRPGAPVVHEEHGVGRYQGLQIIDTGEVTAEFLVLEYAGGDKLYVPVSALHLVSRYTGAASRARPAAPPGRRTSGTRQRRKAAQRAHDVAAELLEVQARRAAPAPHAGGRSTPAYHRVRGRVPVRGNPRPGTQAIDEVHRRHERPGTPMDRLVCGDVGFGKTEVAMRAAFIAVHGGKPGGDAGAHHRAGSAALPELPRPLRRLSGAVEVLSRFAAPRTAQKPSTALGRGQGRHRHRHPPAAAEGRALQESGAGDHR